MLIQCTLDKVAILGQALVATISKWPHPTFEGWEGMGGHCINFQFDIDSR